MTTPPFGIPRSRQILSALTIARERAQDRRDTTQEGGTHESNDSCPRLALLIAVGSAALAAVGGARGGGHTPEQLMAAGWTCFLDPGAPVRTVCSDPGHGRPVPGDPNAPPSYNFKLFDPRRQLHWHESSHSCRPLPRAAVPTNRSDLTSSFHRSVTTAASTSRGS